MSQASHQHVQEFLDKLDEIRAVFVLGRRSLPFLEDTIQFVEDINSQIGRASCRERV